MVSDLDIRAIARALAPLAEHEGDEVDAYLESVETLELPAEGEPPGIRVRREDGLAVRLGRADRTWTASRDGIGAEELGEALRQVARSRAGATPPLPDLRASGQELSTADRQAVLQFPTRLQRALRERRVAFPLRLTVRCHLREVLVIGARIGAPLQRERYFSVTVATPWGDSGALTLSLGPGTADELAERLVARFRFRDAPAPAPGPRAIVLGSAAVAVLLHEAVAHALEADTLACTGPPEAAFGVELGAPCLSVLDDPAAAGEGAARTADDEGAPTVKRWLLREGVVEQVLADRRWASRSDRLAPGAGWRSSRHDAVTPRSRYLQLLPGEGTLEDLAAAVGEGLFLPEADRGRLDPWSGRFILRFPGGRQIAAGQLADPVGSCFLEAPVANLLAAVHAVGGTAIPGGAGWCAKGGRRLPVFASCPPIVVAGVEIRS